MTKYPARMNFFLVFILFVLLMTSIFASLVGAKTLHTIAYCMFVLVACGFTLRVCLRR